MFSFFVVCNLSQCIAVLFWYKVTKVKVGGFSIQRIFESYSQLSFLGIPDQ